MSQSIAMASNDLSYRLLEPEIKILVLKHLSESGLLTGNESIINEFTVNAHARRVDLAVVNDNYLVAFEIKSEADSLARLEKQINNDLNFFDKVTVVASTKHIDKVLKIVPSNVAVWEVDGTCLKVRRRGKICKITNKESLIKLMKVNELLRIITRLNIFYNTKHRRSLEKIANKISIKELRSSSLSFIKHRYQTTSLLFYRKIEEGNLSSEDIEVLSLYQKKRRDKKVANEKNELFWDGLRNQLVEDPFLDELAKSKRGRLFGKIPKDVKDLI